MATLEIRELFSDIQMDLCPHFPKHLITKANVDRLLEVIYGHEYPRYLAEKREEALGAQALAATSSAPRRKF